MPKVLTEQGSLVLLDNVIETVSMLAFPFQNDRTPKRTDTISMYVPATFSGYGGAIPLLDFSPPSLENQRATTRPTPITWTHNGGPIDNYIFGVCVVDDNGVLLFAARDPYAPFLIRPSNPVYTYSDVLTYLGEFAG